MATSRRNRLPVSQGDTINISRLMTGSAVLAAVMISTACPKIGLCGDPEFYIETKRESDRVKIQQEGNVALIAVHSPLGISQATIKRRQPKWPGVVKLRLHLRGLERLRVSNRKTKLQASVSSHHGEQRVRLWMNEDENSPLTTASPFWMKIRVLDQHGNETKKIPLVKGQFEMRLPKAMFEGNPESIVIGWIDFYR